jgi:hypothetical protein
LELLLRDEARVSWVDESLAHASTAYLADHLRLTGEYAALRQRAEEKERLLAPLGFSSRDVQAPAGVDDAHLWHWYFIDWLHEAAVPDDIKNHAEQAGFRDEASLRRAVLGEYLAAKLASAPPRS